MEAATAAGRRERPRALEPRRCARPSRRPPPNTRPGRAANPGGDGVTYAEYADRVRRLAAGLAELGVRRGDTVGLMLLNRPEFNICDTAALHLGATPFSIYNTSSPEQIAYLFGNAGNRVVITEPSSCPRSRPPGSSGRAGRLHRRRADELEAAPTRLRLRGAWRAVEPDDLITLCYTPALRPAEGRSAHPREPDRGGARRLDARLQPGDHDGGYLPHAHMADRFTGHTGRWSTARP